VLRAGPAESIAMREEALALAYGVPLKRAGLDAASQTDYPIMGMLDDCERGLSYSPSWGATWSVPSVEILALRKLRPRPLTAGGALSAPRVANMTLPKLYMIQACSDA